MASCVFGAGANELAEASIVASTKVRMTAAATMLVTATGQQDSGGNTRTLTKLLGHITNHTRSAEGEPAGKGTSTEEYIYCVRREHPALQACVKGKTL